MPVRLGQIVTIALLALVVSGVLAAPAAAHSLAPVAPPLAGLFDFLDPIKNIAELVTKVVSKLFGALAKALMPDFLRDGSVDTLKGLVAVPQLGDTRQWRNVGQLRAGTTAIAWALLPLPFTLATVRYLIGTFTDGPHPVMAVARSVGAAFGLVIYPWAATQAFAFVNVMTNALLSLPAVGNGLQRAVGVLFGTAIIAGIASPFLACLALVAIVLGTLLFGLKIAVVMIAAVLYVAGPLVIALAPLQETAHLYRAWMFAIVALLFIPIGWCLIFAVAGALTLDATNGGISAGLLSKETTAALAALLAFGLAVLWPKVLIGQALHVAAGLGIGLRGVGTTVRPTPTPGHARAATRQLRDGALTVGSGVGRAMGNLGAPAGGAVGWAGRLLARTASVPAAPTRHRFAAAAAGAGPAASAGRGSARTRFATGAAEPGEAPGRLRDGAGTTPIGGDRTHRHGGRRSRPQTADTRSSTREAPPSAATQPRRRRPLTAEQRAVLDRLPRETPPRVREAVRRAKPGRSAQVATRTAQRAGAPLSPSTRRAVFAAAATARARDGGTARQVDAPGAASAHEARHQQVRRQAGAPPAGREQGQPGSRPGRPRPEAPAPPPGASTGERERGAAPQPSPPASPGRPRPRPRDTGGQS